MRKKKNPTLSHVLSLAISLASIIAVAFTVCTIRPLFPLFASCNTLVHTSVPAAANPSPKKSPLLLSCKLSGPFKPYPAFQLKSALRFGHRCHFRCSIRSIFAAKCQCDYPDYKPDSMCVHAPSFKSDLISPLSHSPLHSIPIYAHIPTSPVLYIARHKGKVT